MQFLFLGLLQIAWASPALAQVAFGTQPIVPRNLPYSQARAITALDVFNNPMDEMREVKGNPYLDSVFRAGTVETLKGRFSGLPIRYHIYDDLIEIRDRDSVFLLPPDTSILKIELGKKILVVRKFKSEGKLWNSYFFEIEIGKLSILGKMALKIIPAREPGVLEAQGQGGFPARFERDKDYYYCQIGDGKLNEIKASRH